MPRYPQLRCLLSAGALLLAAASAIAAEPLLLENEYVRVAIDPRQGGAVTDMLYKNVLRFPLIAERGAGVAGSGVLFAPAIELGGKPLTISGMKVEHRAARAITLLASPVEGLSFERTLSTGAAESGFSIRDQVRNDTGGAISVRIGTASRQRPEPWRLTQRSWIGDSSQAVAPPVPPLRIPSGPFFWRQIEQYGTGFLYRVERVAAPVELSQPLPGGVTWRSEPVTIPAHGKVTFASTVWIDEGGGAPDQRNAAGPVLVRSDVAAAGRSGEPLIGFATVVSPVARRARVVVTESGREIARADLQLVPGKVERVPFTCTPARAGDLAVRTTVLDAGGVKLADAEGHSAIDGAPAGRPQVWEMYTARMPEEHYRGSWREIGEQMAANGKRIGGASHVEVRRRNAGVSDADLSFYAKRFPFYTEMLAGASKVSGIRPAEMVLANRALEDRAACMDVAFFGPDGPINAFSKERSNEGFKGLGYVQVLPARGYAFHLYMNYGVNSEGLSTSGATLNEDPRTTAIGHQAVAEWKQSGRRVMPPSVSLWMLLAMCRNVDEALAMIQDPEAPLEFTGNLLLLDRGGNAARVESVGIDRQVFRRKPGESGFFVAGNYPHRRADGLFAIGPKWGWAANTMLRERFLEQFAGSRADRLSLRDVISLMQTHEAGGMCQHIHDNPGELYTSCSFIAVTRTGDLWLSQGPPCQVQYVRHTLKP